LNLLVNDQKLLAKSRRKRIVILEIATIAFALVAIEVYFDFLGNFAAISHQLGHDRAAEVLFSQALFVQEHVRGSHSPALMDELDDVAYFYYDSYQSRKAVPLVDRSLAICKANFGSQHRRCAWTLSLKSLVYDNLGKFSEAESMAREALPILETAYGKQSYAVSSTLNRLGLALDGQGRFAEAETALLQALAIREALYGLNSPGLVPILHNLAGVYAEEGKEQEAVAARRRAEDITAHTG
jgi:tetratricopeptide (TPR) repeat protein